MLRRAAGEAAPRSAAPAGLADVVVPLRHWGRLAAAVVVLGLLGCLLVGLAANQTINRRVVGRYLLDPLILHGVAGTLKLAVISQVIGIVLGVIFAVMRQSPNPVLSGTAWLYIWFFRGTPLLVQIIFWGNFGALYSHLVLGVPFTHLSLGSVETNTVLINFVAAIVALSLNEGAYMAEVVRAGLLSVDEGQTEAALSLGMGRGLLLRRIVLPQAVRVIIPPTGNEFISMLKNTALVEVISGGELFTRTSDIYSRTLDVIPLLVVASLWYLAMTTVLSIGQYYLERRFSRGGQRALRPTPLSQLRAAVLPRRLVRAGTNR